MPKIVGYREVVHQPVWSAPVRGGMGAWRKPRRGLGRISSRTRSSMASGAMSGAVWMLGLPAAVGAGAAYLKRKDEDTIIRWAIWGGLIGLAAKVALTVVGVSLTGLFLSRAMADPLSTAGRALQTVSMGRC